MRVSKTCEDVRRSSIILKIYFQWSIYNKEQLWPRNTWFQMLSNGRSFLSCTICPWRQRVKTWSELPPERGALHCFVVPTITLIDSLASSNIWPKHFNTMYRETDRNPKLWKRNVRFMYNYSRVVFMNFSMLALQNAPVWGLYYYHAAFRNNLSVCKVQF